MKVLEEACDSWWHALVFVALCLLLDDIGVVERVSDVVCRDLSASEPTTVQSLRSFDGIFYLFETDIDLSLCRLTSFDQRGNEEYQQ